MYNVRLFHIEMVNKARGVNEIIEGEDVRTKAHTTPLLNQMKGMVICVFICTLHRYHESQAENQQRPYKQRPRACGPGNPERCLMKGMTAAQLAELSACIPCPLEQFCFYFYVMLLYEILYIEMNNSTYLKKWPLGK